MQKISQVEGVGQVGVGGGVQPAVRIRFDPTSLAAMGLGIEDLRAAVASSTANQPKGGLGAAQASRSVSKISCSMRTNGSK